jgi:hypothetical protein
MKDIVITKRRGIAGDNLMELSPFKIDGEKCSCPGMMGANGKCLGCGKFK